MNKGHTFPHFGKSMNLLIFRNFVFDVLRQGTLCCLTQLYSLDVEKGNPQHI